MKKQKLMCSMTLRKNLSEILEDIRFRDVEIVVTHYKRPIAKLVCLTDDEKRNLQNSILKKDSK